MNKVSQNIDNQFVVGILENDLSVVKKIYESHLPGIISFVKKNNGHTEDAKDIFQDAILLIYDKAQQPDFKLTGSFYSFLFGICRFLWLRQLKKKHRKEITIEGDERYKDETDLEALQLKEEKWRIFNEVFARLGEDCQKVLRLFFDGKSMKEIGEKLDFKPAYVKLKKHRCKQQFSEWMRKDVRYKEIVESRQ